MKLSIIIPVYNVEAYLPICVESVAEQTFVDYEVILVDDGSTDTSGRICDEYAEKRPNFQVIHQENQGLSAARNSGIERASGDYLLFLDSNDYYYYADAGCLGRIAQAADGCDIVAFNWKTATGHNAWDRLYDEGPIGRLEPTYESGADYLTAAMREKSFYRWYVWIYAVRRAYWKECGFSFSEGSNYEDFKLTYRVLLGAGTVHTAPEACYVYRAGRAAITAVMSKENFLKCLEDAGENILDVMENKQLPAGLKKALCNNFAYGYWALLRDDLCRAEKKDQKDLLRAMKERKWIVGYLTGRMALVKKTLCRIPGVTCTFYLLCAWRQWSPATVCTNVRIATKRLHYGKDHVEFVLETPAHGNIGDQAITYGEQLVIQELVGKQFTEISDNVLAYCIDGWKKLIGDQKVFVNGGGFIGSLWSRGDQMFRMILHVFRENEIVVLPQTVYFDAGYVGSELLQEYRELFQRCKKVTFFVREKYSYQRMLQYDFPHVTVKLMPDMATYLRSENFSGLEKRPHSQKRALLCMRKDHESIRSAKENARIKAALRDYAVERTDTIAPHAIPPRRRKREINKKLAEFSQADLIVTDRLHGMVLAAIAQTPCVVFNNCSDKVKGVYEWIKENRYIQFVDDIEELEPKIAEATRQTDRTYHNEHLLPYFEDMVKVL